MSDNCLKKFIGILLVSGYHRVPQERLYWSINDVDLHVSCVQNCMPKTRFTEIKSNIHFNDNSKAASSKDDKIFKVRPLMDKLNKNFKQWGIVDQNLSIDEQMVRYYGHHHLKQFLKGKPIRYGFKQWVMCSEDGYCYEMEVYQGGQKMGPDEPLE